MLLHLARQAGGCEVVGDKLHDAAAVRAAAGREQTDVGHELSWRGIYAAACARGVCGMR
jgi:hypothetical protein